MTPGRMEAFSDGVIAILITVMVLELRVPAGPHWSDLHREASVLLTYVLSFVYLAIYWNNHHHMLKATRRVNGLVLWANMHLLFWLSLVPFTTGWMGQHHFATTPTAAYGIVLLAAALAYFALQSAIIADQRDDPILKNAVGRDLKGKASPLLYMAGIGLAYVDRWLGVAIYVFVALIWLVPDRRVASAISAAERLAR
ncbi:MAG TPA: TMEM175 family protein [Mycobacteriales bacterium]|nr:TMEM175 family protein [Mycobacteriales bacterium]